MLRGHFGGVRDYLEGVLGVSGSDFEGVWGSFGEENRGKLEEEGVTPTIYSALISNSVE